MKSKKFKIVIIVFLLGILINVLGLGLIEKMPVMGLSDEKLLKEKLQENLDLGEDITLKGNEVNALFKNYFQEPLDFGVFKIKGIAFKLQEETLSIYIPFDYKNISLVISSSGQIAMEDGFVLFSPNKIYLGKIPLPKKLLLSKVNNVGNRNIKVQDQSVYISKSFFPLRNTEIFKVQNGKLLIKSSQILQEDPEENSQVEKGLNEKSLQSLESLAKDLSKVERALKGQEEKKFIQEIQNSVRVIIQNPNLPYEDHVEKARILYSNLSTKQKNRINWEVMIYVNMEDILLIKGFFEW